MTLAEFRDATRHFPDDFPLYICPEECSPFHTVREVSALADGVLLFTVVDPALAPAVGPTPRVPGDCNLENLISIVEDLTCIARADLTAETEFTDLDMDSLDLTNLIAQCDENFDISIPDKAVSECKTIGNLCDTITALQLQQF